MHDIERTVEYNFQEIPKSFVPVHIQVEKSDVEEILTNGLDTKKSKVFDSLPEQEELIERTRKELGIEKISRRNCIFAYPTTNTEDQRVFGSSDSVTIETYVDPEKCWVVDAEFYTYMSERIMWDEPEEAKKFARFYWESRIKLSDYVSGNYDKNTHNFMHPEVLIQQPTITSSHIKMLK
jgi:hypothetical protein